MTHTTRDLSALRAEVESLKALVLAQNEVVSGLAELSKAQSAKIAEHEEYLQITADALRTLQKKALQPKAEATKKTAPAKPEAKKSQSHGLSWAQLTREGKKSWNAYAFRSQTYGRSKEAWSRWSVDRLTMTFPKDII